MDWIKIKDKEELPTESGLYFVFVSVLNKIEAFEVFDGKGWSDLNANLVTHYQKIKTPNPPLEEQKNNISEDQIKKCEEYLKHKSSRTIVKAFGEFIILASDKYDLLAKQTAINNGNNLGFYRIKDVLKTIENKL